VGCPPSWEKLKIIAPYLKKSKYNYSIIYKKIKQANNSPPLPPGGYLYGSRI